MYFSQVKDLLYCYIPNMQGSVWHIVGAQPIWVEQLSQRENLTENVSARVVVSFYHCEHHNSSSFTVPFQIALSPRMPWVRICLLVASSESPRPAPQTGAGLQSFRFPYRD